jgi:hypothetical protein
MTKNPDVFMPATMSADPAVAPEPEPEPEPEIEVEPADEPAPAAPAAPAPASPTTGDTTVMLFVFAAFSACALILAKRRIKSK